jgi:hypothetical protein
MAKTNEKAVAVIGSGSVPNVAVKPSEKLSIGNVDASDIVIPRVKLLQAISPEVEEYDAAKPGHFWHTLASESLGPSLRFVPIIIRKSYVLWAPRGDQRGILARANDGEHWDVKDAFKVKPKGSAKEVIWSTECGTVSGSGLSRFGSSIPDDSNSQPAAALVYQFLAYFPDYPELSPSIILNTRSSIKPATQLVGKIQLRPANIFDQLYVMNSVKAEGAEGPYYNYQYISDGFPDKEVFEITQGLYHRFAEQTIRAADENEDVSASSRGATVGTDTGPNAKF